MILDSTSDNLVEKIINAIRTVTGPGRVQLHEPQFKGNEQKYVKDCIDSTFVSSLGKYVDRFEQDLAEYTGAKHAIATVNGTAALHIALKLAGVKIGDEVLVPALTFVATANAVSYCGAIPHFVDSEEITLGIDSQKLRNYLAENTEKRNGVCVNRVTGRVIRALVAMHTFGHPGDIDGLLSVSRDFNLAFVEDAAESIGSTYHGRHTGTFGLMGTLSFNGNKTITAGGGGAILTNDSEMAKKAKHLTTTAKVAHQWNFVHDEIGYNYRMPNLNAALACAQLEQLPRLIEGKRKLYGLYQAAFKNFDDMNLFSEPKHCKSNYWLQTIVFKSKDMNKRDLLLEATNANGIMTRPAWTLMHMLLTFKDCPKMSLDVARSLSERIVNIPSSSHLVEISVS